MTDTRKRETYEKWTAVEAGIIEDVRRQMAYTEIERQIKEMPDIDPATLTVARYVYPMLACIEPVLSFDDFRALKSETANALYSMALRVNPEWDELTQAAETLAEIEKKSENKQPDGISNSQTTPKTGKKRRHSPAK